MSSSRHLPRQASARRIRPETPNSRQSRYDPYGTPVLTSNTSSGAGYTQNPYLFKGGIQDRASGLVKFGLRWYNPTTGTFTQQDTLDTPLDPTNANRYAYAGDDPVNSGDPQGRSVTNDIAGALTGIVVGLGCEALTLGIGSFGGAVIGTLAGVGTSYVLNYFDYGESPSLMGE